MGAEQVSGLGNLFHGAVQSIDTAGQEINHPAGHGLVHILHVDNHGLAAAQVIGSLGGIVEAVGTEQNHFLLVGNGAGRTHVQHLAAEAAAGHPGAGGAHEGSGAEAEAILLLGLLCGGRGGSGGAGAAGGTADGTLFGLLVMIDGFFLFLVVIIVIIVGIGLGKFLYVIPKTHFLFLLLYVHINTDVSWRIMSGTKNCSADPNHGAAIHDRVGEIVGHSHG